MPMLTILRRLFASIALLATLAPGLMAQTPKQAVKIKVPAAATKAEPKPVVHKAHRVAARDTDEAAESEVIAREAWKGGEEDPSVVVQKRWIKEIVWDQDAIPSINAGVNIVTTVLLPPTERIVSVQAGNTGQWGITPVEGKNVLFLKPIAPNQYTNMVVITNGGRLYTFHMTVDPKRPALHTLRVLPSTTVSSQLVGTPGTAVETGVGSDAPAAPAQVMGPRYDQAAVNQMVNDATAKVRAQEQAQSTHEKQALAEAMLTGRNDKYSVSYDRGAKKVFQVSHVFDVGGMTYVRVLVADGTAPAFQAIGGDGKPMATQFSRSTMDPNVLIVDGVYAEGLVVVGEKKAHVINNGLAESLKRQVEGK